MEKKLVPLDLVLGLLKDDKAAHDKIDAAFPIDPPRPSHILASRGDMGQNADVLTSMPPGTAHRLHDALDRVLRHSGAFMERDLSRSARRIRDEEHEVLQTLRDALASALRLPKE